MNYQIIRTDKEDGQRKPIALNEAVYRIARHLGVKGQNELFDIEYNLLAGEQLETDFATYKRVNNETKN